MSATRNNSLETIQAQLHELSVQVQAQALAQTQLQQAVVRGNPMGEEVVYPEQTERLPTTVRISTPKDFNGDRALVPEFIGAVERYRRLMGWIGQSCPWCPPYWLAMLMPGS